MRSSCNELYYAALNFHIFCWLQFYLLVKVIYFFYYKDFNFRIVDPFLYFSEFYYLIFNQVGKYFTINKEFVKYYEQICFIKSITNLDFLLNYVFKKDKYNGISFKLIHSQFLDYFWLLNNISIFLHMSPIF